MPSKEEAKLKIAELIKKYEALKSANQLDAYNEANTRKDFIMPLFEALGWDVRNAAEVYEEQVVSNGSVDYAFKFEGTTKFYLEAKRFSVDLEEERWAEQAINYAWYKSVCWAILSDFEEIKIFNAEWREPYVSRNIFLDLKYTDYLNRFDDLWLLSKEGVSTGLLDQKAEQYGKKEKRRAINEAIFDDLLAWRKLLLDDLNKLKQPLDLPEEEREEIVQKILDRFIFIRSCEDRGIEEQLLRAAVRSWEENGESDLLYKIVVDIYKRYYLYDNNLFVPGHPCEKVHLYNNSIKIIINGLYYNHQEKLPYDFKSIPADILGGIYEQYLGHILKRGKLITGRPHRKEKGIYYTPKYVVDYIVDHTLGKALRELPRDKAGLIKILDPACGSGSFLIKALEVMDNYYAADPHFAKFPYNRRVKALQNNIYGVDLDEKAVEIAQLNLMLRALSERRALPNVSSNIKCGNSLISGSPESLKKAFGPNYRELKPFNWEAEFKDVFERGGFDVVIGNPPYLKELDGKAVFDPIKNSNYVKYYQGKMDFWYFFLHRAIDVCKDGGYIGFITNSYFLKSAGASKLIDRIKNELVLIKVVDFEDIKVFGDVSGKHMIHIYQKRKALASDKALYVLADGTGPNVLIDENKGKLLPTLGLISEDYKISFESTASINFSSCLPLGGIYEVSQGVVEAPDKISKKTFESKRISGISIGDGVFVLSKEELSLLRLEKDEELVIKKYLDSSAVSKYKIDFDNQYLIYADKDAKGKISKGSYPHIKQHLDRMAHYITSSNGPYGLHRPRENKYFNSSKLICKGMFLSPEFTYDDQGYYVGFSFSVIIQKDPHYSLKYLLGVMNSKLGNYWFQRNGKKRGIGVDIGVLVFRQFPVYPAKKSEQNAVERLVDQMLDLNKRIQSLPENSAKWLQLKEEIAKTDKQIDAEVYKLYGLTDEEIKVVEGAGK